MADLERPDWAYDGAEVWRHQGRWTGIADVQRRTVIRSTPTQLIVTDDAGNEERYSLKKLEMLGDYKKTLVSPEHPSVHAARRDREVRAAMAELWEVLDHLSKGATLHRSDLEAALENATLIRDAAIKAVDDLKEVL